MSEGTIKLDTGLTEIPAGAIVRRKSPYRHPPPASMRLEQVGEAYLPSIKIIAAEAGCTEAQARAAVTSALRSLHHAAVSDQCSVTASILATYFEIGPEACYHFSGILEEARIATDPELPWAETMERFAPHLRPFAAVLEKWRQGGQRPDA